MSKTEALFLLPIATVIELSAAAAITGTLLLSICRSIPKVFCRLVERAVTDGFQKGVATPPSLLE